MLPRELSKAEVYHSEFPMTIMYLSVCLCAHWVIKVQTVIFICLYYSASALEIRGRAQSGASGPLQPRQIGEIKHCPSVIQIR